MKRLGLGLFTSIRHLLRPKPLERSDGPHQKGRMRFFFGSQLHTQIRALGMGVSLSQLSVSERVVKHYRELV
jgi:hypothetical protein